MTERPILLLSEVFPPRTGGSGRWLWEIYRRLPPGEAVIAAGQDPRQAEFDRAHDLRLVRLPLSFSTWGVASPAGLLQYGRALRRVRRLVRDERVGALHCGKCLPEGLLAWFVRCVYGVPYVCYVHGEELNLAGQSRELAWLTRRVLRSARLVIANSRNTERLLREGWGLHPEQVEVLNPGVDTERFRPAPADPAARARLGWDGRPVVLTVGRLQKRKGHDQLILALRAVRQAVPDVLYAVLGDGEERATLEDLVRREELTGHVQFLGELPDDDLVTCYQQCDLFALPNRQVGQDIEGFGMVLVEAQACGKPVVAGRSGGTAETMNAPETGLLVAAESPEPIAGVLVELLRDAPRRDVMGRAARRWAVERFDWDRLSRRAEQLFQGVGAGRRPSPVPARQE